MALAMARNDHDRLACAADAGHMSDDKPRDISIALSGGGHRAALFAVGAILALTDAELNKRTGVISSVSGGSITNGLLAKAGDFETADRAGVEGYLKPGVAVFCKRGLFLTGPDTDGYVRGFFALVGLVLGILTALVAHLLSVGRDAGWATAILTATVATVALEVVAIVVVLAAKVRWRFAWGLLLGLIATVLVAPAIRFARYTDELGRSLLTMVVVVAGAIGAFTLAVWWFGRRGLVVDQALRTALYGEQALAGLKEEREVHHVFCATNLASGTQAYLSPRLVSGYLMGTGEPAANLKLSTAVQCSAAFPGGFNARRLQPEDLFDLAAGVGEEAPPRPADLVDGGVYDNMGDQWELGWLSRQARLAKTGVDLGGYGTTQSRILLVVNAGGHYAEGLVTGHGLRREVGALLKDKSVMYDQTTAIKRRYLYQTFVAGKPLLGAIIQISQSPYGVPGDLTTNPQASRAMRTRAEQAKAVLTALGSPRSDRSPEEAWTDIAEANGRVGTVLSPIELETAVDLIFHAYVLTRINAYVLLGEGQFPTDGHPDPTEWGRQRFLTYAQNAH
jgi:hypothetical protein